MVSAMVATLVDRLQLTEELSGVGEARSKHAGDFGARALALASWLGDTIIRLSHPRQPIAVHIYDHFHQRPCEMRAEY